MHPQIAGGLGCYNRMLISETLPGICYAGGMIEDPRPGRGMLDKLSQRWNWKVSATPGSTCLTPITKICCTPSYRASSTSAACRTNTPASSSGIGAYHSIRLALLNADASSTSASVRQISSADEFHSSSGSRVRQPLSMNSKIALKTARAQQIPL
jgi:hypothetical protein